MKEAYLALIEKFKATKQNITDNPPYYFDLELPETALYNNVCIVGGGLAGYLTAIAFRKFFNIPVTVIESSRIGPIGVGEATTPLLEDYLFTALGLDKKEFLEMVEPTWKLGIKFIWGKPGDYYFNYPFDSKDILSAYLHNNDVNKCSLNSILMSNDSSFVARIQDGADTKYHSLAKSLKYAYHLDNKKFIHYLKFKAQQAGVTFLDEEIADGILNEQGGIEYLVNKEGDRFAYDFFVDCSGFRSLLLEKKLKVPYVSYGSSLFNNSAVTTTVPNGGHIKCYTTAETMSNGWCWNIPLRHEDHRGYVFSSDHCTDEQAYEELLLKNPSMTRDVKFIRFRSGRHTAFIIENIAAIGNAYSFVEPLESTGVHMIIDQVITLMNNFINLKNNPALRTLLNENMNEHWDYIRWFLSIHFKFNRKLENAYWTDYKNNGNIDGFKKFIDLYKEIGLLTRQDTTVKNMIRNDIKDTIFDLYGIDHILFSQGVLPGNISQLKPGNKASWDELVALWNSIAKYTIPLSEDLDVLLKNPQLI